jgi:hypothetical protein
MGQDILELSQGELITVIHNDPLCAYAKKKRCPSAIFDSSLELVYRENKAGNHGPDVYHKILKLAI